MISSGRIIHGDCINVLPKIVDDESVDLVLTDPPYLVDYHDRTGHSIAGDKEGGWLRPAFLQIARVMKDGSYGVCFYGWNRVDQFMAAWRAAGLRPVGHLVFVKNYESAQGALGYWHEAAYLLQRGERGRQPHFILPDIQPWKYTGNKLHPTQKPVPSLKPIIEAFTQPGELVLDPFCGSGSTLLAAKILGRRYLGVEVDPKFAGVAKERLQ